MSRKTAPFCEWNLNSYKKQIHLWSVCDLAQSKGRIHANTLAEPAGQKFVSWAFTGHALFREIFLLCTLARVILRPSGIYRTQNMFNLLHICFCMAVIWCQHVSHIRFSLCKHIYPPSCVRTRWSCDDLIVFVTLSMQPCQTVSG